jgi:hypothetical protein
MTPRLKHAQYIKISIETEKQMDIQGIEVVEKHSLFVNGGFASRSYVNERLK